MKRLHPCRTCKPATGSGRFLKRRGFTRHDDGICSTCRQERRKGRVLVDGASGPAPTPSYAGRGA